MANKLNRYDAATAIPLLEKMINSIGKEQEETRVEIEKLPTELYRVEIFADNGNNLNTNVPKTTLKAIAYSWDSDITDSLTPDCFSWTRVTGNDEQDKIWNRINGNSVKTLTLDGDDVGAQATFICTVDNRNALFTQSQITVSSTFTLEILQEQANNADSNIIDINKAVDELTQTVEALPEDIEQAKKTADTFIAYDDDGNVVVGCRENGTFVGGRVQITPTGFNVLNNDGQSIAFQLYSIDGDVGAAIKGSTIHLSTKFPNESGAASVPFIEITDGEITLHASDSMSETELVVSSSGVTLNGEPLQ